jgi:hypothetical protein
MNKVFDKYCIDASGLESARERVEAVLPIRLVLHESMFWGGDYYLFESDEFGEIAIRRNQNSYTGELNEPDYPDCQLVVSVSEPRNPDAVAARLAESGLRLLNRSVV